MPLFLLFVAVPLIEIALFIQIGGWLGLWPTLGLVILSAVAGTVLMRAQGMAALGRLQGALASGGDPTGPLADGAAVLIAGMLLLTPGFFTDSLGIALLVPAFRARIIRRIGQYLMARAVVVQPGRPARPDTVDAEFEVVDPGEGPGPGQPPSGWVRHD